MFDITQSNDKQHGTRSFCPRSIHTIYHNSFTFYAILYLDFSIRLCENSATSQINFIEWNTTQRMCVCMIVCTCVRICSNKLLNKKVTFCCFVVSKYAQIYVFRIRHFNACSIHNTFQKWQSYFACHLIQ